MATLISVTQVNRDLNLLWPVFADALGSAIRECRAAGYMIEAFEAWRAPQRQDYLYAQGRTRDGKVVTDKPGWQSWHQFCVASDLAFKDAKGWTWEGAWDKVIPIFKAHGLESLAPYEQSHVQMTNGLTVEEALDIYLANGLPQVWIEIQRRAKSR